MYEFEDLKTNNNSDFMNDKRFIKAYQRGLKANHLHEHNIYWRVHIALWAAETASKLEGDFVECGTSFGFTSSAIMEYLNWDSLDKIFYLYDNFQGVVEEFAIDTTSDMVKSHNEKQFLYNTFTTDVDSVKENFSEWKNVKIIIGNIPETLSQEKIDKVAFLHIDLNSPLPEMLTFFYFWEKIVKGGIILFDDYAYYGYENQKKFADFCSMTVNRPIVSLPTGQGMMIKN